MNKEERFKINMEEIFDDLHENISFKRYGKEVAAKTTVENAVAFVNAGIPIEQVASILNLSREQIEDARKNEEIATKTKVESIPKLLRLGLTSAQIADALDVPLATVESIARKCSHGW